MTVLLTFDTASPLNSVALLADGRSSVRCSAERGWAESILQHAEQLLAERDLAARDLTAIGVVRGPGSFTGVRIGLAVALGLHQSLSVPAGAFCTHDVLDRVAAASDETTRWLSVVDAHRGRWFVRAGGLTPPTSSGLQTLAPEAHGIETWDDEQLRAAAGQPIFGVALQRLGMGDSGPLAPALADLMTASSCCDGHTLDPLTLSTPLYLQRPQLVTAEQAARARAARSS